MYETIVLLSKQDRATAPRCGHLHVFIHSRVALLHAPGFHASPLLRGQCMHMLPLPVMSLPSPPPGQTPTIEPARSGAWTTSAARSRATTSRTRRNQRRRCRRWGRFYVGVAFRLVRRPAGVFMGVLLFLGLRGRGGTGSSRERLWRSNPRGVRQEGGL